jgi:hypothetical protein
MYLYKYQVVYCSSSSTVLSLLLLVRRKSFSGEAEKRDQYVVLHLLLVPSTVVLEYSRELRCVRTKKIITGDSRTCGVLHLHGTLLLPGDQYSSFCKTSASSTCSELLGVPGKVLLVLGVNLNKSTRAGSATWY